MLIAAMTVAWTIPIAIDLLEPDVIVVDDEVVAGLVVVEVGVVVVLDDVVFVVEVELDVVVALDAVVVLGVLVVVLGVAVVELGAVVLVLVAGVVVEALGLAVVELGDGDGVLYTAVVPTHVIRAQSDESDFSVASPGCETPVVQSTTSLEPWTQAQHGSPSSWPLVCPSPSVSAWQNSVVHT